MATYTHLPSPCLRLNAVIFSYSETVPDYVALVLERQQQPSVLPASFLFFFFFSSRRTPIPLSVPSFRRCYIGALGSEMRGRKRFGIRRRPQMVGISSQFTELPAKCRVFSCNGVKQ